MNTPLGNIWIYYNPTGLLENLLYKFKLYSVTRDKYCI